MAKSKKSGSTSAKTARASKAARKRKVASKPKAAARKLKAAPKRKAAKAAAKPKAAKAKAARTKAKLKLAAKAKPKAAPKKRTKARSQKPKPKVSRAPARKEAPKPQSLVARIEAQTLKAQTGRDWSATLFLPKTDFPMKAGLPEREPELLKRWERLGLYERLRAEARGRETFVLHDGPPYANGHIHIGTGLNKILKDVVVRSQQMMGKDANYVPGWDCHGLPIEWKVEEENYRAKGKSKPDLSDAAAMIAFRAECRAYAEHWLNVQREEFKRLGGVGDWAHPYTTMSFDAEATIAAELMKFAMNGLLYRGSKPVMWSVVERTALAEAEVEYDEIESPAIWVKFPVLTIRSDDSRELDELHHSSIVIWTTTPWTIPGNRAIAFSENINYGLYEITEAPEDNWAKVGDRLILADKLAEEVFRAARVTSLERIMDVDPFKVATTKHPLRDRGYDFDVPLLAGEHVTEDTGTGFVHTAP
ncbi:MAG: class I tRNA ligase family protein, partial [Methyloceanibacter sp.]